jgi:hypothetical protein
MQSYTQLIYAFIVYDDMFRPLLGHLQVISFNLGYSKLQILYYLPLNIVNYIYVNTRWFKYDGEYLCVNKSQFVPVIFEPPCILKND